jgi:uncharacterized protein (UPF0332 family)
VKLEAERRLAKADRFLAQAAILPSGDVPEAIVHLTYYAMLHAAAAVLIERTGRAPKTHGTIIGQFALLTKDQGDRARSLGRAFNWAEDLRLASDYVTGEVPSLADVTTIHATAREFVAYCRSLL